MKCGLGRCRDAKSEEVPFCMGCYAPNQIRSNGIGREHQRQFISSVRSHPDRTPLSRTWLRHLFLNLSWTVWLRRMGRHGDRAVRRDDSWESNPLDSCAYSEDWFRSSGKAVNTNCPMNSESNILQKSGYPHWTPFCYQNIFRTVIRMWWSRHTMEYTPDIGGRMMKSKQFLQKS